MMAADLAAKPAAESSCCKAWKEKCSKVEEKRNALRQAVKILTQQIDAIQAENANLRKAYGEEQARADNEKEGRLKESLARASLENEISALKSEISSLQQKVSMNSLDRDQEVRLLQDHVSEREKEINQLKELLEKERKRAATERKNAEREMKKASEALKSIKAEKSKFDEEREISKNERQKAEQFRLQLELLKKEADEAKSKLAAETLSLEQANKKLEAVKSKANKERRRVDAAMAKAEEWKKLAETNGKKVVEEKHQVGNSSQQLDENKLQELHKFGSSGNLAPLACQADNKLSPKCSKRENRLQLEVLNREVKEPNFELDLLRESNKKFEFEKTKTIREEKCADAEIVKQEELKKLAEVNWKMAKEEKFRADQLSQQLQEQRRTIEELQKKMHELLSSRKLVEGSAESPVKSSTTQYANVKLLKKQLKLEKMRVKQAKEVAKLEKRRNSILQQELGCFKLDFDQFAKRLDLLNKSFSPSSGGIHGLEKSGQFASMQRLNMKKNNCSLEPVWTQLQSENKLMRPSCIAMDASGSLRQSLQESALVLPTPGGNFAEPISGINSNSEFPLGCSNWKVIQTSAINSSTTSFSDGQLMGSQERGAFSVTTSAKLAEDNLNTQPTISNLSGEVTKVACSEKSAEVAENNVKIPHGDEILRGYEHSRKRKRALDSVESIEYLYSKGRKLHMQMEEKLSCLHGMLGRQLGNPLEEGRCLVSNQQHSHHAEFDRLQKTRVPHEEVIAKHFSDVNEQKNTEKVEAEVRECSSSLEIVGGFKDVADGDYMKLLDLDNMADEERYRMALEMPLSPTLPDINFHDDKIADVNDSEALVEKWINEGLPTANETSFPVQSFDVIDVEINSNKLKHDALGTSHSLLPHRNVSHVGTFAVNENNCSTTEGGKTSSCHVWDSGLAVGMSNSPISNDEEAFALFQSELGAKYDDIIPKYCVVFPNMRDGSTVSRIFGAAKTCIARCSLYSQTEWAVPKILLSLEMEQNLILKEKVCVFFTMLLLNLSAAAPRKLEKCLNRDSILCMDSFSAHMHAVMSDVETRSMFADLGFLDELLGLIEEFLIEGRIMMYCQTSSGTFVDCGSRIDLIHYGVNVMLLYEVASANQLVAGSIILASICAVVDQIGIICEASYNIFRRHASDSSLVLTIIHVFAYLGGQKYFCLSNCGLMMTVLKSLVTLLEGVNLSGDAACCPLSVCKVQTQVHPCTKCPFSEGAVSVDTVTSLLIELLQDLTASETTNIEVIKSYNSLNSRVLFDNLKPGQSLGYEGINCVADMDGDTCSLGKYDMLTTQSHSGVDIALCCLSDALSLVELLACNLSWDWTSINVIPHLLKILQSCVLENFAAAIIVLLGQLGRLGVDAGGYDDKVVENLRCNLSVFLSRDATRKAGLPIQIATVTSLLGLLPLDFETLVQRNAKINATAGQPILADCVRKWFSSLSKEQQELSLRLLRTSSAKKETGTEMIEK